MPGWIIQGVRGEGKSLCAVGRIREYLRRGCPVATNLNLYLDKLLDDDSDCRVFRLPDFPRYEDFKALPAAYDADYGGEDKNGLIVLDECALWLNSREWNKGDRLNIIKWLLQSRKDHWDLILLVQDHTMLDSQVINTLCDYLVVSSRTDRQKIPYLGKVLDFVGLPSFMPKIHIYQVFYGLNTQQAPTEVWKFIGTDLYAGYNTNQKFYDDIAIHRDSVVDMRAIYSLVPPVLLTGQKFIAAHQLEIERIQKIVKGDIEAMAKKSINNVMGNKPKIILLSIALVAFVGWRLYSGINLPGANNDNVAKNKQVDNTGNVTKKPESVPVETSKNIANHELSGFVDQLLAQYKPRLAYHGQTPSGLIAGIEFYDGDALVETLSAQELHALGVAVVKKAYGVALVTKEHNVPVMAWSFPVETEPQKATQKLASNP